MRAAALLLAAACLTGCQTSSTWERYDESGYEAVMHPSDETAGEHIAVLEEWATGPEADVPAGFYIELGYWLAKVGRSDEARQMFEREIERYPYTRKYVEMLSALLLPAVAPLEPKP